GTKRRVGPSRPRRSGSSLWQRPWLRSELGQDQAERRLEAVEPFLGRHLVALGHTLPILVGASFDDEARQRRVGTEEAVVMGGWGGAQLGAGGQELVAAVVVHVGRDPACRKDAVVRAVARQLAQDGVEALQDGRGTRHVAAERQMKALSQNGVLPGGQERFGLRRFCLKQLIDEQLVD